ncbi:MAG: hypothetical protein LBJ99_01460 [Oscillospiraceae bacterium]|nr:hypothetical protein [Oscillospiraceae bacterium]
MNSEPMGNFIERVYMYHEPKGNQSERYTQIRDCAKAFNYLIERCCPNSHERSLAYTRLEEAVMWANASIAWNE